MNEPIGFIEKELDPDNRTLILPNQFGYSTLDGGKKNLQAIIRAHESLVGVYIIDKHSGFHALGNFPIGDRWDPFGLVKTSTFIHYLFEKGVISKTPEYVETVTVHTGMGVDEPLHQFDQRFQNNLSRYLALHFPHQQIYLREVSSGKFLRNDFGNIEAARMFDNFRRYEPFGPFYDGTNCFLDHPKLICYHKKGERRYAPFSDDTTGMRRGIKDCWERFESDLAIRIANQLIDAFGLKNRDSNGRCLLYDVNLGEYVVSFHSQKIGESSIIFLRMGEKYGILSLRLPLSANTDVFPALQTDYSANDGAFYVKPYRDSGILEIGVSGYPIAESNKALQKILQFTFVVIEEYPQLINIEVLKRSLFGM